MKPSLRYALICYLLLSSFAFGIEPGQQPLAVVAPRVAAVAMPDQYGTQVSSAILQRGGNAIDATIAAAFALAVTYPGAANIGGGGFLVAQINGEAVFLDFREKAPLAADRDMYLDGGGEFIERSAVVGSLAVGVPGTVKGMQMAHQRYGTLPWQELLAPAIALARDGFLVDPMLARERDSGVEFFAGEVNFAEYFGAMDAGTLFRQPELARTLERIAADPDDFYRGRTAAMIVAQMDADGGLITAEDLDQYTALWRAPMVVPWRGHTLLLPPPPSSGGIAIAQLLTIHDAAQARFGELEHNSAGYIHFLAEIEKRVFADRGDYLGDPDFGEVPVAALTDPEYLRRRALELNVEGISPVAKVLPGLESHQTTHFSIMDGDGNAVSMTYTLNWGFGSGVVVEGAGFLLNDEMDDFSAKPGVPNKFGVVGGEMNAIAPGKRMLSSMTPTIVLRDGQPVVVVGTPGGSTIFTSVFQVLLNLFDYDMDAQQAVAATRFHHQLPEGRLIRYDNDRTVSRSLQQRLEQLGYVVEANDWGPLGDVPLVVRRDDGQLEAAADPRGWGTAAVITLPPRVAD